MDLIRIGRNAKTTKSDAHESGYLTGIMYLAPDDLAGRTVCPFAKIAGCSDACLNTAGKGGMTNVQQARIRKTQWMHDDWAGFQAKLVKDMRKCQRKAKKEGKRLAIRLNGTSDLQWETFPIVVDGVEYANIMTAFPDVQFYDYTKIPTRKNLPTNYRLVYSYSEATQKAATLGANVLNNKPSHNVAVVFRKSLPETFGGRRVIDGDQHDLRFLDPDNVVVGLVAKGPAKRDTSGFVQP